MRTFVVLIRGINVGGRGKVAMPALRSALEELEFEDVVTYIQSGNAVFRAKGKASEVSARVEKLLAEEFGVRAKVLVRTPAELVAVEAANPFPRVDRSKLYVMFLSRVPTKAAIAELDPERSPSDEFAVLGKEVYLHFPGGAGRTKLTIDYFERNLGVAATNRNWNTLRKLIELGKAAA